MSRTDSYLQSVRLTAKQRHALELLEIGARIPETWTGALAAHETYWDGEIGVATINPRTAESLRRLGYIEYGESDPEWGTEIVLLRPLSGAGDA